MNGALKEHIKDKKLELEDNTSIDYSSIYDNYFKDKFEVENIKYGRILKYNENCFVFRFKNKTFYFFLKVLKFKLVKPVTLKSFEFCSSNEIEQIIKKEKCLLYLIKDENKYNIEKIFNDKYSMIKGNEEEIIFDIEDNNPPNFKIKQRIKDFTNISDLSDFFYDFFKWDVKSNSKLNYWETEERNEFISEIDQFQFNDEQYIYKIFGPSSIGKSMTLFMFSRKFPNIIYLNLKTLKEFYEKNDFKSIYGIIIEACQYCKLNEKEEKELDKIFKSNYENSHYILIEELINFLLKQKEYFVIIFDQFKENIIDETIFKNILIKLKNQNKKYISLIICVSSNDKKTREDCILSIKMQYHQLNEKRDNLFRYYDTLGKFPIFKNENDNKNKLIMEYFGNIPKYKVIFNETSEGDYKSKIDEIKNRIKNNLKNFYKKINKGYINEEIDYYMINCLSTLKKHISEGLTYDNLDSILNIIPLKYFTFHFSKDTFIYEYSYKFIEEVVNEIIDIDVNNYFIKRYDINHTGYTTADYFEMAVILAIQNQKLQLPKNQNSQNLIIKIDEIVKMKDIVLNFYETLYNKIKHYDIKEEKYNLDEINSEINQIKEQIQTNNHYDKYILYNQNTIYHYKLKYLNNLKKKIEKNNDLKTKHIEGIGDLNIYVKQNKENGKCVDFGYFTGESNNKIYYGFQIKAYDGNKSNSTNFKDTKKDIKEKHKEIFNAEYLLGIKLKGWNFTIIIYYNENKDNIKKFSEDLVKFCNNNNINYIFYEPFKQIFYNENIERINCFQESYSSNLDSFNEDCTPSSFIYEDYYLNYYQNQYIDEINMNQINSKQIIQNSMYDFIGIKTNRTQPNDTVIDEKFKAFYDLIETKLNIHWIKLLCEGNLYSETDIPKPKENYLFYFKGKDENESFIAFKQENEFFIQYYKYNGKNLDKINDPCLIFHQIDKSKKYQVFKIKISKTRNK